MLTAAEQSELDGLNAALLAFRTGQLPARIVYNGVQTDFSKLDLDDLRNRIGVLNDRAISQAPPRPHRSRGAIRFRF